jgi:hypothetical protein
MRFILLSPYLAVPLFFLLAGGLCIPGSLAKSGPRDASWQKTVEMYSRVPCLTEKELEYGREIITGLDYNSRRIFRRIALMPGIDFPGSREAWILLLKLDMSYEQVLVFEQWSGIDDLDAALALAALPEIKKLGYEAGRAFTGYCKLPEVSAQHALNIIPLLVRLDDARNRAARALFAISGINAEQALDGLGQTALLSGHRARAAEALFSIPGMTAEKVLEALPLVAQLHQDDAWNIRTLFLADGIGPDDAWFWLTAYFAVPPEIREEQYFSLDDERQRVLLRAYYEAGEELIWKINNLHAVTDRFGFEISNYELQHYSVEQLKERFTALSPQVVSRYANEFYAAGGKNRMTAILKSATARERMETARRMTSANIYALLAQGSELYDSSFRDILVPVLIKRIAQGFSGNLLTFLQAVDAENQFVSSFIVSLAQKGKLTAFFPENPLEQEQILDLVARSAFQDEDSIILFSATFMYLLEVLQPSARSFLVGRMSQQADDGTATYARLITVILQYYLQEFPELLGDDEKTLITRHIVRHGATDLHRYLATPFAQWKTDGALDSISVFHPDDDGRDSFRSYAEMLLRSGYTAQLSEAFTLAPMPDDLRAEVARRLASAGKKPSSALPWLFASMQRHVFAISFTRALNGLTITHSVSVYSSERNQELLLERFIKSGTEMFAQRGHSYWRSEQITDPLRNLLQKGRLTPPDFRTQQRFLSLGSCGGVKAYTGLNRLFLGNVDILATIGSGLAVINDPYNKNFFEVVAKNPSAITWKDVAGELAFIFQGGRGRDYLQPGSLPAILHKILNEEREQREESPPAAKITERGPIDPAGLS